MNKQAYERIVGLSLRERERGLSKAGALKATFINDFSRNPLLYSGIVAGAGLLGMGTLLGGGIGLLKWQKNKRIKNIEKEIADNTKAIEDLRASGADSMMLKEYVDRNVILKTELGRINSLII